MQLPPAILSNLSRIHFGALCLAALLFLFPWTDLKCNGREMATQSGAQAIYAGFSPAGELAEMGERDNPSETRERENDLGYALLTLLALVAILGGAALAGIVVFRRQRPVIDPAALAAAALILLLLQTLVGFPIDREAKRARAEMNAESRDDPTAALVGASMSISTSRTGWFYLELLALAIPAGLLIYQRLPDRSSDTSAAGKPPETADVPPAAPPSSPTGGDVP